MIFSWKFVPRIQQGTNEHILSLFSAFHARQWTFRKVWSFYSCLPATLDSRTPWVRRTLFCTRGDTGSTLFAPAFLNSCFKYSTSSHNLPPHNLPLFSGSEKTTYGDLLWFQDFFENKVGKRLSRFNPLSTKVIPNSCSKFLAILALKNSGWSLLVWHIHPFLESFNLPKMQKSYFWLQKI